MPTETDYAWAAGILDGEGYIGMVRFSPGLNRRKNVGYQVRLNVRMTHEPTIRRLYKLFGGTFTPCKASNPKRHKVAYSWYVGDLKTVEVLTKLMPYLVTKKKQARLILDYRRQCCQQAQRSIACTPVMLKQRNHYYQCLRDLNRKGPA